MGGRFTTIDDPGSTGTSLNGINDAGEMRIQRDLPLQRQRRFRSFNYVDGNFSTIDVPGVDWTLANGINNAGQIVGFFFAGEEQGPITGFIDRAVATRQLVLVLVQLSFTASTVPVDRGEKL